MALSTRNYSATGTSANNSWTIVQPSRNTQDNYTIDGAGGTDTLSFERLSASQFTIYAGTDGLIHIDSISGASHHIAATLTSVEKAAFSYGRTVIDLTAYMVSNHAPTGNVTIMGSATQGQTLTATNTLADAEGMGAVSYQWLADGVVIAGATGASHQLTQAEVGKAISVKASYTDGAGNAESVTSSATAAVANINDAPTGSVSISGSATQGQTLSAGNSLADADGIPASGSGAIQYQWLRDGVAISGATGGNYTLGQSDVGHAISVQASYTDLGGRAESVTSAATAMVANINDAPTGSVSISGSATQGQTLSVSNSLADADGIPSSGSGAMQYQWVRDGVVISGATGANYALGQSDVGHAISVQASYTDLGGSAESVTSAATAMVANINDAPTGSVSISGSATQGQTLSAGNSLADADGIPASGSGAIQYQWLSDGVAISGATGGDYTLGQSDVGHAIAVQASYTDLGGSAESVTSAATAMVANVNDAPTGSVSISGSATQGQTLSAGNSLADADGIPSSGSGAIQYQWVRDGVAISGATGGNYTLGQSDVGHAIAVRASYTDLGGSAESVTSAATAAVANVNDVPTGSVSISGSATQGQTLSAGNSLADADGIPASGSGAIQYQWLSDGVAISGARGGNYTLSQSDVGHAISLQASYTDLGGSAESVTSAATAAVANVNDAPTGIVSISGQTQVDQVLSASNTLSDPDGMGVIGYQWLADGVAIAGATADTLSLTNAYLHQVISVAASYVDGGGTLERVTSAATAAVTPFNHVHTGGVSVVGAPIQGGVLSLSQDLADADGLGSFNVQWFADGVALPGALGNTLSLTQAEVGRAISVTISYTDAVGNFESASSDATLAVSNVNDVPSGGVRISGTVEQGQTLSASNTLTDADGIPVSGGGAIAYQWLSDGAVIGGATGDTYTLGQGDVGHTMAVRAHYTDNFGQAEQVTSSATAAVANINDAPTGRVSIGGTAVQGQTLAASNTLADADGIPSSGSGAIQYQWFSDGVVIAGATDASYMLGQSDVGHTISVHARYTDNWGHAEQVASSATAAVANINDLPTGSVSINGNAAQGQILTASNSLADADGIPSSGSGAIQYQWLSDGVAIAGAKGDNYTLGQSDVGHVISVRASYTDNFGQSEQVSSSATAAVANANDAPTGSVSISGTATQGQTLAVSNTLADADGIPVSGSAAIQYQWLSGGVAIAGATGDKYTLGQGDVGHTISVQASYTDLGGSAESITSTATVAVANVNDAPMGGVNISGTAAQGQTLSASNTLTDADGIPSSGAEAVHYQWLSDGLAIHGATGDSYTLGQSDVGHAISVQAIYTDNFGQGEQVTSPATAAVANMNDAPTGGVSISGSATQGQTLTVSNTLADADGIPVSGSGAVQYQWFSDGAAIRSATDASYTLGQTDVGHAISVQATYTDNFGQVEQVASSATAAVININDAPTGGVSISGAAAQGQTLIASNTLADADGIPVSGSGAIQYQWLSDGAVIAGATGDRYTLGQSDVGHAMAVRANYTDNFGQTEQVASSATATVANVNDAPTGSVRISGVAAQGETLVASNNLSDLDGIQASGAGALSYQWLSDGALIPGATGAAYTLGQSDVGHHLQVQAQYTDGYGQAEQVMSQATDAVTNVNDPPVWGTSPEGVALIQDQAVTLGVFQVTDADQDWLSVDIQYSGGAMFGLVDQDSSAPGLQWSGTPEQVSAALGHLSFAATSLAPTVGVSISDGQASTSWTPTLTVGSAVANPVSASVEAAVPGLTQSDGTVVAGDGNGDGIADVYQGDVSSTVFTSTLDSSTHYATLAATPEGSNMPLITAISQNTAVQLPSGMNAPLGQLVFSADVFAPQQDFSLFVETALGINGYWKQTDAGDWVNLASSLYGGQTTVMGDVTRLDFHIQDGGPFDADGTVNGVIVDPGVIANYSHGLSGVVGMPPVDYWF